MVAWLVTGWMALGLSSFATAAPQVLMDGPVAFVREVTDPFLKALDDANKGSSKPTPVVLRQLVHRYVYPYVDFEEMAQWVCGRNAWFGASASLRTEFVDVFRDLVLNTYVGALSGYHNQVVDYLPLRGSVEGRKRVQVSAVIRGNGREPIHIDYKLIRKESGWKFYDLVIEGVSLLKGYQAQFSDDIRQVGLRPSIERIRQHNAAWSRS